MKTNNEISFTVFGNPIALKRHRMTKTGHSYDPSASDKADFLAQAMASRPNEPMTGPLMATMYFAFNRPQSHFNSRGLKLSAPRFKTGRPDADNLVKFVLDSLNGIFFRDDSQVVKLLITKAYEGKSYVSVNISEIDQ